MVWLKSVKAEMKRLDLKKEEKLLHTTSAYLPT